MIRDAGAAYTRQTPASGRPELQHALHHGDDIGVSPRNQDARICAVLGALTTKPAAHGRSAKLKTSLPAQIATYCMPSTAYVMGDALKDWPVLKCQRAWPVAASTASRESASSATNTSPPAVVSVPPQELPTPCSRVAPNRFPSRIGKSHQNFQARSIGRKLNPCAVVGLAGHRINSCGLAKKIAALESHHVEGGPVLGL